MSLQIYACTEIELWSRYHGGGCILLEESAAAATVSQAPKQRQSQQQHAVRGNHRQALLALGPRCQGHLDLQRSAAIRMWHLGLLRWISCLNWHCLELHFGIVAPERHFLKESVEIAYLQSAEGIRCLLLVSQGCAISNEALY